MKIFCIGLNKTGTISLHQALTILGFRSLHWGGQASRIAVERAIDEGAPLLTHLPEADAYSDIQRLSLSFDVLDEQYPGSRFILTTRSLESWIDSRRRHVERNRVAKAAGEYDGTFLEIEPDRWRELFLEHHERVRAHFRGRGDLLEMDVTAGDGYEVLCPFLECEPPGTPFPWRNRDTTVSS